MRHGTFGKALGALILQKRRTAGLTQLQLSEDAFGDSAKVRRISELENGQVAVPHPKTIDPIIATLKITDEEIAECARQEGAVPDPDLDRAYREARNLIEALAYQFEHSHPECSFADLDEFLHAKAREWQKLRARVETIDATEEGISACKEKASIALSEGRFDQVDAILADLEDRFQQERTLKEVAKQSEIRVTRGDACLMNEDPEGAIEHYLKAARYFQPFSEEEMARLLDENAHKNYQISLRTLRPRFGVGIALLDELLKLEIVKRHPDRESEICYQLSLISRNAALHSVGDIKHDLLSRALDYARQAEAHLASKENPFKLVCTKVSLANCLLDQGRSFNSSAALNEAITILRSAKVIAREEPDAESLLSHVCNSLGSTILAAGKLQEDALSDEQTHDAFDQFSTSIESAEKSHNFEVWGAAKANRAGMIAAQSQNPNLAPEERIFIGIRAIAEFHGALESFPETAFPGRFADVHFELANVLNHLSLEVTGARTEFYQSRAIHSYQVASNIYQETGARLRWAECQMYTGSIIARHSRLEDACDPKEDLTEGVRLFRLALTVFSENEDTVHVEICQNAIALAEEEIDALNSGDTIPIRHPLLDRRP
jgi:tetratricopeptide (TPR) repeat protein